MDENTNTVLMILAGVIILAVIFIGFRDKLPDIVKNANENVTGLYQTQ